MKKILFIFGLFFLFLENSFAKIAFSNGDINQKDEILFTVEQNIPGTYKYKSLIETSIKNLSETKILTCFPEQMELLNGGKTLQIRNRYGISEIDLKSQSLKWKFQKNFIPTNSLRCAKYSVSPNGKWVCYFQKIDWSKGVLILENVESGKRKTLDSNADFTYDSVPVKWSPDSSIFIYEKDDFLYFSNPESFFKDLEVSENFRKIGKGTIESANFAGEKYLIYIDGDLIYKIGLREMYTTALYSDIIGKGKAIGRLPTVFNPKNDIFSCNDFLSGLFVIQNKKFFNFYKISSPLCQYVDVEYSGPFFSSDSSVLDSSIFWTDYTKPVVWVRTLPYSGEKIVSCAYEVSSSLKKLFQIEESDIPYLSPDLKKIAFFSEDRVFVYDTQTWKPLREITGEKIVSIIWKDNETLILGGEKTIRFWDISSNVFSTVFLSSCDNGYFSGNNEIFAEFNNGQTFKFNQENQSWHLQRDAKNHENQMNNGRYRLFCGETPNSDFENAIYVRTLSGKPVTKAVYEKSIQKKDEKKNVALIFDAYDSAEGLSRILYELKKYKVSGTFFLNGEFIRRYPNETRQISNSQNECASMFFTTTNLVQNEFIINEEFIRRGLARNEDEFFECTKKELNLFWHAPFYQTTEQIKEFSKKAGYTYVSVKNKNFDTVTLEQAIFENKKYVSPSKLIEEIMENLKTNNGGTVPVTVGISNGTRSEYLYDYLPLLLSAILDEDFNIVPVKYLQH